MLGVRTHRKAGLRRSLTFHGGPLLARLRLSRLTLHEQSIEHRRLVIKWCSEEQFAVLKALIRYIRFKGLLTKLIKALWTWASKDLPSVFGFVCQTTAPFERLPVSHMKNTCVPKESHETLCPRAPGSLAETQADREGRPLPHPLS